MTGVGDAFPWGVGAAYLIAGILLLLALRGLAQRRTWAVGSACALIGLGLAIATVVFTQSAVTLAQQLMALLLGSAGGYVAARNGSMPSLPRWMAAFQGMTGLAAMATAVALYRDAASLNLADPVARIPWGSARIGIALAMGCGGMSTAGAVVAAMERTRSDVPLTLRIALPAAILGLALCFQLSPATPILWSIAGLSIPAGVLLLLPLDRAMRLCLLALSCGGAAAALGLALHNPAMLIGGAATLGTTAALALLLRRGAAMLLSKRGVCP